MQACAPLPSRMPPYLPNLVCLFYPINLKSRNPLDFAICGIQEELENKDRAMALVREETLRNAELLTSAAKTRSVSARHHV